MVCGLMMLCGFARRGVAQVGEPRARWALGLAADIGGVSDAMAAQCGYGHGGSPMLGAGAALLFAPRSWLIMAGDLRMSGTLLTGCKLSIPAAVYLGDNQWEYPVYRDYRNVPTSPLTRSAVRIGVQTPPGLPLLRATVGGGLLWSSTPAPFGAATVGIGSRGTHVRFYAEFEADVARVRVFETRTRFHVDSVRGPVVDSRTTTPVVIHPRWGAMHIGVELPFASR